VANIVGSTAPKTKLMLRIKPNINSSLYTLKNSEKKYSWKHYGRNFRVVIQERETNYYSLFENTIPSQL